MKIGSLFSGIGGLDLAAEAAFDGKVMWSVEQDKHCCQVLSRHFRGTIINEDVQTIDPHQLPKVDILTGGWPCVNLSVAGDRTGLDGKKSRLYLECLRFAEALQPTWLVFENVPGVLKYQERIEKDLSDLGYGSVWIKIAAGDVGAPHWRKRVFIIARKGAENLGVVTEYGKIPENFWPTAVADGDRVAMFKQGGEPLGRAVRWPTPTARDWKSGAATKELMERNARPLSEVVRWPTPTRLPGRLSPDWVETLMGFPVGWTKPEGINQSWEAEQITMSPCWPMGRGEEQNRWEPPRLLVGKKPVKGRPARLRALGNAVVPSQGYVAIVEAIHAFEIGTPVFLKRGSQLALC